MTSRDEPATVGRAILVRYKQSYVAMNVLFYGLIGLGMLIVVKSPQIQAILAQNVQRGLQSRTWSFIVEAYGSRQIWRAACLTFLVNFVLGTVVEITLPSLLIPFIGIGVGMCRALLWGFVFGPGPTGNFRILATHWPVMLLEGQGYVLGMLSVYIHGKGIIIPSSVEAASSAQGYGRGFRQSLRIYPWIALTLAIAALYEAAEVVWVVHR